MDADQPSLLRRVIAVAVLLVVAVIALRLVVGFVAGLISALLWIVTIVVLIVAFLWARSTLKSGKRRRDVDRAPDRSVPAAPSDDPVAAEMEKIMQQLREQGRG